MIKNYDLTNSHVAICGMGRIDNSNGIELEEYAIPQGRETVKRPPVQNIPQQINISRKIGRTVYDITANFDIESKRSVLQQFMQLILSAKAE